MTVLLVAPPGEHAFCASTPLKSIPKHTINETRNSTDRTEMIDCKYFICNDQKSTCVTSTWENFYMLWSATYNKLNIKTRCSSVRSKLLWNIWTANTEHVVEVNNLCKILMLQEQDNMKQCNMIKTRITKCFRKFYKTNKLKYNACVSTQVYMTNLVL